MTPVSRLQPPRTCRLVRLTADVRATSQSRRKAEIRSPETKSSMIKNFVNTRAKRTSMLNSPDDDASALFPRQIQGSSKGKPNTTSTSASVNAPTRKNPLKGLCQRDYRMHGGLKMSSSLTHPSPSSSLSPTGGAIMSLSKHVTVE